MADCIANLFEKVDCQMPQKDKIEDVSKVKPYKTDGFETLKMLTTHSVKKTKKEKSRRLKKSAQAGLRQKMKEPESFVLMARINFLIIGNTKRKIPRSR